MANTTELFEALQAKEDQLNAIREIVLPLDDIEEYACEAIEDAGTARSASLYILIFPDRQLLKVGKANNVHARHQKLKQAWGEADYGQSFELVAPQTTVFRLEKALHIMLSAYGANIEEGDGCTEMFSLDALDAAIKHIEIFAASSKIPLVLKKGVTRPPVKLTNECCVMKQLNFELSEPEHYALKVLAASMPNMSVRKFIVAAIREEMERVKGGG